MSFLVRRTLSTAAVLLALFAMVAPWAVDAAVAVHVALDAEHAHDTAGSPQHDVPATPTGLHGHVHQEGTPPHDHGFWLPDGVQRSLQSVAQYRAAGTVLVPPLGTAWHLGACTAIAPSPPTVSTTILRV